MFSFLKESHNQHEAGVRTQEFNSDDARELTVRYWTDPNMTAGALRNCVIAHCWEVLKQNELDWDDIRKGRARHAVRVRGQLCCFAYEVLCPWMHETEIGDLLGIKVTGFNESRKRWLKNHGPKSTGKR
tara:strand:+ start:7180 stop:7566 length:387 start_codon:yes stop_codon:yes gene_type:complete